MWKTTRHRIVNLLQVIPLTLILCGVFGKAQIGLAADVQVRATLPNHAIYLGDHTTLELRVNGARDTQPPALEIPGIEITQGETQQFNNSSMTIINGRTTRIENFGYVAKYRLHPHRTGVFQIPALTITHDGNTYSSQPLQLTVKAPDAQDLLLVNATTDKPSYVLGERITLTLEVSLRQLTLNGRELDIDPFFPNDPPHLQIPWFDSLGEWKTTDLQDFVKPYLQPQESGFHINNYVDQRSFFGRDRITFTLPRQPTKHTRPSGTFTYYTYRLQKTFRPIRAGTETVAAVLVKATLPTRIDAQHRVRGTETVVASSAPLNITVHPVPSANQPSSFNGSVGQFQLSATATPTALKVGDPLTLTVTVHGQQDSLLETVRPLALHEQTTLTQDFKVPADPPTIKTATATKTFTYTLRPRHAEVQAIPPIDMAYFDPETQQFNRVRSQAIALQVEGGEALPASDVVVTMENGKPKSRLGRALAEGLLANYTGAEVLIPQRARLQFTPIIGAWLILPPMAYLLTLLGQQWLRQRRRYPERQRSKRAARVALNTLQDFKTRPDADDIDLYEGIHQALTDYIRDKLNLTSASLTVDDVSRQLHSRGLSADLIDPTTAVFHLCDNARYAPGTLAVAQRTHLIDDAIKVVQHLEDSTQL